MNKAVKKWREATNELAKAFTKKYYPDARFGIDTFWVGDEVGDVFFISDMFFNVDRMVAAIELNATIDQLHDYHDAEMEHAMKETDKPMPVNFKNYVKYGFNLEGKENV